MTETVQLLKEVEALGMRVCHAGDPLWGEAVPPGVVHIGVHATGPLPVKGIDRFDVLLTQAADPPAPWVMVASPDAALADLHKAIEAQPFAASVLVQVLRLSMALDFEAALLAESFAYSTLLASEGFRAWQAARAPASVRGDVGPRVRLDREGEATEIVLNRPRGRNAIDAAMRDALCEALEFALLDGAPVILRGEGAVFSIGGDLAEFGQASDPATAHAIRVSRSPVRLLHAMRDRVTARVHGPCVGAGIEIPAAAARIVARPRTTFRLPEVGMGVIPGAGGTVTIPRRIGRHRTCWMALGGQLLDIDTALAWGLVDAVEV